jgi:NAD(P)-dependent dehydrogenase (short-subunit alcohol dehydrogenase family)
MPAWGPDDMPDLDGRRAIVTGATSGIGLATARALASAGAGVVLAVRDEARGRQVAAQIERETAAPQPEVRRLDLADLASVRAFAAGLPYAHHHVDLLVNNAGVMATPLRRTADGFELQLGTNHLGHFALTGLVLPLLLAAPAEARVVTVASQAHRMGRIDFDDLNAAERHYRRWPAYGQSKLANLLFAFELQRRADAAGVALRSLAAHPGWAATELQARGPRMRGNRLEELGARALNAVIGQSPEGGALPTLFAATADIPGGSYVGPGGMWQMRGGAAIVRAAPAAYDVATARRLWEVSEQLTGVHYSLGTPAAT